MISLFPCLNDNYGLLLHEPESGLTASIDAPDAGAISKACAARGWILTHIFNTHHHYDHVGGNLALKEKYGVTIVGPEADEARIPGIDVALEDGAVFTFGAFKIEVLHTPGHTKGHCAYYVPAQNSVFVGDTLFALGCGRLFEGTAAQMFDSIAKLAQLPDETKVYCAHEYTLSNGAFAISANPENEALKAYIEEAKALRAQGLPTVPTTIGREKTANPFMRAATPEILGDIRAAKDRF